MGLALPPTPHTLASGGGKHINKCGCLPQSISENASEVELVVSHAKPRGGTLRLNVSQVEVLPARADPKLRSLSDFSWVPNCLDILRQPVGYPTGVKAVDDC